MSIDITYWFLDAMGVVFLGSLTIIIALFGVVGVLFLSQFIWEFIRDWKEDTK